MNRLLKVRRDKYQQGSIRRVKRASGFAWEFRDVGKRLPENVNMIAVTMGVLGLRRSETLGLNGKTSIGKSRR
jgi:hypothetical protein